MCSLRPLLAPLTPCSTCHRLTGPFLSQADLKDPESLGHSACRASPRPLPPRVTSSSHFSSVLKTLPDIFLKEALLLCLSTMPPHLCLLWRVAP